MAKGTSIIFLCAVAMAASLAATAPKAASDGDCTNSPVEAVVTLPAPLSKWAQIACTPFGHVLTSHEGWIWVWPDGTGTVFIPSQMVARDPAPLGNTSYFTNIEMTKVAGEEFDEAYDIFRRGLEQNAVKPEIPCGFISSITTPMPGECPAPRTFVFAIRDSWSWTRRTNRNRGSPRSKTENIIQIAAALTCGEIRTFACLTA